MVIGQHHVPAALHPEKYLGTHWIWRWAWLFLGKRLSKFEPQIAQPIAQSLHGLSFDWISLWRSVSKVLAILFFPLHTLCRQQLVIFPKSISFIFQMSATFVDIFVGRITFIYETKQAFWNIRINKGTFASNIDSVFNTYFKPEINNLNINKIQSLWKIWLSVKYYNTTRLDNLIYILF
jgi:hypothetical protein